MFSVYVSPLCASAMSRLSGSVSLISLMASLSCFVITAGVTDIKDVNMMVLLRTNMGNTPSTWKGGDPCGSEWVGVSCTGSRITSLSFSSMNLKGQLPDEIGSLSALQILDLSYNPGLTGLIPSSLGNLQHLQTLILIGCGFSGRVPEELGNLQRLVTLDMNSNKLSGSIPPSLSKLTRLYWFDLANNSISGEFPVEMKGLVNCAHFHFNKNKLSGSISPDIFHEKMTLKHVLFDDNLLTGEIPSTIGNVSTLTVLRLDQNSFEGPIPSNIAQLKHVNELHLSNNLLNGSIPDLSGMANLQYVDLSNNSFEFSDVPTWLSALVLPLTTVVIESSNLNGKLPSDVFSLPQLETLRLSNNSIDGILLITEGKVSQQLQLIDLRNNDITDVSLGKSYTKTLMLEFNPVCSQTFISNSQICHPEAVQETSYQTNMAHCENAQNCTGNLERLHPKSCQCVFPYVGTMILRAPTFSTLTNTARFQELESSLWEGLKLTERSVYLCCMWVDANKYLNIQVQLFPPSGRKYFEQSEILNLGFVFSNQTYKPPLEFGPYYFIPIGIYIYFTKESKSLSRWAILGIAVGAAVLLFGIIAIGIYALLQRRKAAKAAELSNPFASWGAKSGKDSGDAPKLKGARFFSFEELKMATNNFSRHNEIGTGGYGKVYKGVMPVDGQMVAVKRAKKESSQGGAEFKTELELLSMVHHKNLVGLIGFSFEEGSEQMLVYEYMPNGSLRDNLSGKTGTRLDWWKRSCIALGSARGLAYLHEHVDPPIIHRDVKSTNILLDENMNAKVADFGLSKLFTDTGNIGHVSTQVKGTMGYLDPEYYMSQQLTQKSDVYSFGVVLMELLSSRQPLVERGKYLVHEVKTAMDAGGINEVHRQILDPFLKDYPVSQTVLESFVSLSLRCVEDSAVNRPKMSDVVKELELIVESLGGPYDATETEPESPAAPLKRAHHPYNYPANAAAVTSSPSFEYSGGFAVTPTIEPK